MKFIIYAMIIIMSSVIGFVSVKNDKCVNTKCLYGYFGLSCGVDIDLLMMLFIGI